MCVCAPIAVSTVAATLFFVSAIVGWCGILLNNRAFLTVWNLLLWVSFAFLVAPGYIAYKKHTFNLEGKTNELWSRSLGVADRRVVQNTLSCCGYYNPAIEASETNLCYARSALPGCKGRFLRFERRMFRYFYTASFALVGPHLALVVVALLASNHVTYRFGKGITPPPYQLDPATARTIKDDFLTQLSHIYGADLVRRVLDTQRRITRRNQRTVPGFSPASLPPPPPPLIHHAASSATSSFSFSSTAPAPAPPASGNAAHTLAAAVAASASTSTSLLALPPDRHALFAATSASNSAVGDSLTDSDYRYSRSASNSAPKAGLPASASGSGSGSASALGSGLESRSGSVAMSKSPTGTGTDNAGPSAAPRALPTLARY